MTYISKKRLDKKTILPISTAIEKRQPNEKHGLNPPFGPFLRLFFN